MAWEKHLVGRLMVLVACTISIVRVFEFLVISVEVQY